MPSPPANAVDIEVRHFVGAFGPGVDALRGRAELAGTAPIVSSDRLLLMAAPRRGAHSIAAPSSTGALRIVVGHDAPPCSFDVEPPDAELGVAYAGSFASCTIDRDRSNVWLERCSAGSRRLYIARGDGVVVFGSQLDRARELWAGSDELDPASLWMFVEHLQIPAPFTPWRDWTQLTPGERRHYPIKASGDPSVRVISRIHPRLYGRRVARPALRGDDAVERLDRGLTEGMRSLVAGAGRAGLLLSGGKDSASLLIACPDALRERMRCLIVASPDSEKDEASLAQRLADDYGHRCDVFRPTLESLDRAIDVIGRYEMPIADPTAVTVATIADSVSESVDRLIDGTGNDSLFGSPPNRHLGRQYRLNQLPLRPLRRWLSRPQTFGYSLRRTLRKRHLFFLPWDGALSGIDVPDPNLTAERWLEVLRPYDRSNVVVDKTVNHIIIKESSGTYHRTELLGEMAGTQVAYPFLGRELTEALLDLDVSELYQGTTNKVALRRWLERNAPPYIHQKPKGFFAVPVEWLLPLHEAEFREFAEAPGRMAVCRAGLPEAQVGTLLRKHLAGERQVDLAVWALLVLESWITGHLG